VWCLRILATTDFHGSAEAFRKTALKAEQSLVDIVIVCGDVTHFGTLQQGKELLSLLHISPVLFVPGNCDLPSLVDVKIKGIESIHGKCRKIDSVNFLGLGGSSPSPFDTPFELSEVEIANLLEKGFSTCQAEDGFVLVSHPPPKDTKVDVTSTGQHVGSFSVRDFIEKTNPNLVLCGHIHEATGIDKISDTIIVNPGPARHQRCAIIDINEDVRVKLDSL